LDKVDILKTSVRPSKEMFIYECGYEYCASIKPFEYKHINYYLIHYIIDGEGYFIIDGVKHHLKKGDGFFIPPYKDNHYYPDPDNPWVYRWVGFNGTECKKLLKMSGFYDGNYTFTYDLEKGLNENFLDIYLSFKNGDYFSSLGFLYQGFGKLIKKYEDISNKLINPKEVYVDKAIEFIEENYNKQITVAQISKTLNIDRSHFFKCFRDVMNINPQQYLINYRLSKSQDLLRKSSFSISTISSLVGFSSPEYYSRIFKKHVGITPIEFRGKYIKIHE
jgi:AraC-like DNA-binding protein